VNGAYWASSSLLPALGAVSVALRLSSTIRPRKAGSEERKPALDWPEREAKILAPPLVNFRCAEVVSFRRAPTLVGRAHVVCPHSNATRANGEVTFTLA
jgi:hypothetical protein